jgi:putative glutamine amidotransferase
MVILKSAYNQPEDSINHWLKLASGIVITGGEDIHPTLYGKDNEIYKCESFDTYRDTLEMFLIRYSKSNKLPLLGICRGEQMLNVALGGSLITDIPSDILNSRIHRDSIGVPFHEVNIDTLSFLYKITGVRSGLVNSYHHQCVDIPANGIFISARSTDNVPEAIECVEDGWTALGLQWHPEKLGFDDPLAGIIAKWFISVLKEH